MALFQQMHLNLNLQRGVGKQSDTASEMHRSVIMASRHLSSKPLPDVSKVETANYRRVQLNMTSIQSACLIRHMPSSLLLAALILL